MLACLILILILNLGLKKTEPERKLRRKSSSKRKKDISVVSGASIPSADSSPSMLEGAAREAPSSPVPRLTDDTDAIVRSASSPTHSATVVSPRRRIAQRVNSVNILGIEFDLTESSESVAEPIEGLEEARAKLKQKAARKQRLLQETKLTASTDSIPEESDGSTSDHPTVPKRAKSEKRLNAVSRTLISPSGSATSSPTTTSKSTNEEITVTKGEPVHRRVKSNLSSEELRSRRVTLGVSSDVSKALNEAARQQQQQQPQQPAALSPVRFEVPSPKKAKRKSEKYGFLTDNAPTSGTDTDAGSGFITEGDDAHHKKGKLHSTF
jgi:hypothetical protein